MLSLITLSRVKEAVRMVIPDNLCYSKTWNINVVDLPIPVQSGTVYNKDVARYCADLIHRVAAVESSYLKTPRGMDMHLEMWNSNENPLFGALWSNTDVAYVVFRGTACINEWAQDLNYGLESFPVELPFIPDNKLHPSVHSGFLDVYSNFRSELLIKLKEINPRQTIVSGHSLGGAVATICGFDVKSSGYSGDIMVYNFASPRVGDENFRESVENIGLPIYRIVNTMDRVPRLPPAITPNFNNPRNPYIYSHCGVSVSFTTDLKSISNNHMLEGYIEHYLESSE